MNGLTNQQLVLLALLVSFVTSLATGIFTVSLMSQAPQGVVQTINNVVEHIVTQQPSVPTAAVAASFEDKVPAAASRIEKSIVQLVGRGSDAPVGIGLVVSAQGIVMADKSTLARLEGYEAIFADGTRVPMSVVQSQNNGDIAFLAPALADGLAAPGPATFAPISFALSAKLGQPVLSFSSSKPALLSRGIISRSVVGTSADGQRIDTSISGAQAGVGSPLFNADGEVIGIGTGSLAGSEYASFYPVVQLRDVIPSVR